MATKKAQSAPKKKASPAPKKKAAPKKKSVLETKSAPLQEETQEHSAPVALTTPESSATASSYNAEPATPESTSEKEGGLLLKLLVLTAVIVVIFVGYNTLNKKDKEVAPTETAPTEVPAESTPAPSAEATPTEPAPAEAPATPELYKADSIATEKTYDEAVAHCKSLDAKLISQDGLKKLSKVAPDSLKAGGQKYWSSNVDGKKKAFWVRLDNGKTNSIEKTTKLATICN